MIKIKRAGISQEMVLFVPEHSEQILKLFPLNLNNVCAYSLAKYLVFFFTVTNHKKQNHKTLHYNF